LRVGAEGVDGDEFPFRITEGGETTAEDAAGVDVDRAVKPFGFGDWCVAVDDHGLAAVFGGPVVAHGEAEFIGFAGGFAVEGEFADGAGAPSLHAFLHAGVSDDELAVIEHVVTDETVDEVGDVAAEGVGFGGQLFEGFG